MKKLLSATLLAIALLCTVFTSCKKDDKNPSIAGIWKTVKYEETGVYRGQPYSDTYLPGEGERMELLKNGNYIVVGEEYEFRGTWTYEGNILTLYNTEEQRAYVYTVIKFTNSELVYSIRFDNEGDDYEEYIYYYTR